MLCVCFASTVRPAVDGGLKFSDVNILNGNCAFCPNSICGEGYTLMFLVNDVALETQQFDISGGNRSLSYECMRP